MSDVRQLELNTLFYVCHDSHNKAQKSHMPCVAHGGAFEKHIFMSFVVERMEANVFSTIALWLPKTSREHVL